MIRQFLCCFAFAITFLSVNAQAQSCCDQQKNWPMLAMSTDFKEAHLSPLPLEYAAEKGSVIQFNTLDGKKGQAFYVPSDQPTTKALIIVHEWWGLNDYIKREAERWQEMLGNVDIYAVDMFDGFVAADAAAASKTVSNYDKKRGEYILKGLLSEIGRNNAVATMGWCWGGTWAFTAGVLADKKNVGTVMYYGFPEEDPKKIKPLQADVLYVWASRDKFITQAIVDSFGKQVEATGHKFTLQVYDADHAFANPSNPKYDMMAAKQAEQLTLKFLKEKLQLD